MGIFDSIQNMAGQAMGGGGGEQGKVAGGFLEALQEHPGGLGAVLSSFRNNGMADHAEQMASGQQPETSPEQVGQGLNGTGLIEQTAAKAGVSPEVAKMALAAILPMLMAHITQNGANPSQVSGGGLGSMAGSFLSRFLPGQ